MSMQPLPEKTGAAPRSEAQAAYEAVPIEQVAETGGPSGPEPTRFGDWERRGRCIDF
jgi:hypothetical protein